MVINRIDASLIPQTEQYMEWICDFTKLPHRLTGTEEGKKSAETLKYHFERIGLSDVRIEETPSFYYENDEYELRVDGENIACYPINGTFRQEEFGTFEVGAKGINSEIIYLGDGDEQDFENVDVKGKVVVCNCPWFESNEATYEEQWCKGKGYKYDPDAESRNIRGNKYDSYSPNKWPYNYCRAMKAGAIGFVGILNNYFEDGIFYNEDYTEEILNQGFSAASLAGLWIGKTAANKLMKHIANGSNVCNFILKKTYKPSTAKNVIGVLPGQSDDTILVHSHHDAVFSGAVQDASGISEVIGLAEYFSQIPIECREKTLMFLGTDGHYTDYEGHRDFVKRRSEDGTNIIMSMVIEHIGKEVAIDEDNKPIIYDEPELRMMYITQKTGLWDIVKNAVLRNELKRIILMPARVNEGNADGNYEFMQDEIISDAYYNAQAGIPVVSILSPPMYLFHPMDTPEMVASQELRPIARTYAEIIDEIMQL